MLLLIAIGAASCGDVSNAPAPVTGPVVLTITTTTLPAATAGTAYTATLAGSGGTAPYNWLVTPALPTGLSLNASSGAITGTPGSNTIGTTTHTFVLQDAALGSDAQIITLTINPATLAIAPVTLPPGVINQAYSQTTLTATGGIPPYTWSVLPALPNGLQFNVASPGSISGTPLTGTIGTTTHTFTVLDSSTPFKQTASTDPPLSLTITSLFITTNSLPNARVGRSYSTTLARSGGVAPFTWSVNQSLPTGLSLNASTGVITGTAASGTLGTHTRTYTVQDSSNPKQTYSKSLNLTITN
ncbi:MAG: hypothetical protein HOP35_17620 [Nitrospira sp.]|nr:hypothetical protein [Nitrospira sp.]